MSTKLLTVQKEFFNGLPWRVTYEGKLDKLRDDLHDGIAPAWNPDFTWGGQSWFFANYWDAWYAMLKQKEKLR